MQVMMIDRRGRERRTGVLVMMRGWGWSKQGLAKKELCAYTTICLDLTRLSLPSTEVNDCIQDL